MNAASLAALALFATLATPGPDPKGLPPQLQKAGIDQKLGAQAPLDVVFQDENGRSVRFGDYFHDRPVLLSLVYYECPMLCTLVLNGLVRTLRALAFTPGNEFEAVTVSINPDETAVLAAVKKRLYIERYGRAAAAKGWHFLTGRQEAIDRLTSAVGFRYTYDPSAKLYAHASGIMILTPRGQVARYFYGLEYPAKDVRLGLVEASNNKIGSPADQILLFCFQYNPSTGKYSTTVLKLVRAGGAVTALALSAFIAASLRRERRNQSGHVR
jgi:protein SCO1/2